MPDTPRHSDPDPAEPDSPNQYLFAPSFLDALRSAVADLSWLQGRGYAQTSALTLVGDRHQLRERQRQAVLRSSCSDAQRSDRRTRMVDAPTLRGATLLIDGYNALITMETALAGGLLLLGRDGCLRDLTSLHGGSKRVEQTQQAILLLGQALETWGVSQTFVYLDRPVSNSGRLAQQMREIATANGWAWTVEAVANPDAVLRKSPEIIATADSAVLDAGGPWFNLTREVVSSMTPDAAWIDFEAD